MDLSELLGSDFREGMTADEVTSVFKDRFLASGNYELKEKVDAERRASAQKISELNSKLQGSLSDEEIKAQEREALEARIKELEEKNRLSIIDTSRLKAEGTLAETKVLLGVEGTDKEYKKFLDNISSEDGSKTESMARYINKLVKDAYEKGKADSVKKDLGKMGDEYAGGETGNKDSEDIALQKKLLSSKPKAKEYTKSNFI